MSAMDLRDRLRHMHMLPLLMAGAVAACGQSQAGEAESDGEEPPAEATRSSGTAAAPRAATATVSAGTSIALTLDRELSTRSARTGDSFTASVSQPVTDGSRVLIPSGSTVHGRVTAVQAATDDSPPVLKLDFDAIEVRGERKSLVATLTAAETDTEKEKKGEAKKIGGGAAAGALAGGLIGGGAKSALAGAAVGAAAGTAITFATREEHAVLRAGTPLRIRVDQPLQVRLP